METKKNTPTPTEFQRAIQDAIAPIVEMYMPKGSERAFIIASYDGVEETDSKVLIGACGDSFGLVSSIKGMLTDPTLDVFVEGAKQEIERTEMIREIFGAAPGCDCPDCVAARERKAAGKVNPRVN